MGSHSVFRVFLLPDLGPWRQSWGEQDGAHSLPTPAPGAAQRGEFLAKGCTLQKGGKLGIRMFVWQLFLAADLENVSVFFLGRYFSIY